MNVVVTDGVTVTVGVILGVTVTEGVGVGVGAPNIPNCLTLIAPKEPSIGLINYIYVVLAASTEKLDSANLIMLYENTSTQFSTP